LKIEALLEELHIPADSYRLVMLLPLVYVAWADGRIQDKERAMIRRIAEEHQLLADGGHATLERWLSIAPTEDQLRSGMAILNRICSGQGRLGQEFSGDFETLLIAWCQDVADAAGGLLGMRRARNPDETTALRKIASGLGISTSQWKAWFA
jgi:hypothetical protein